MRKLVAIAALTAAAMITGCATSRQITGPDGVPVHSISCDGSASDISYCYEKAGELCGAAGYTVLNRDGSSTPFAMASGGRVGFNATMGAIVTRNIMVRCKATS